MKATTDFSDASLMKTWIHWAQWKMAWNDEMKRNEPRPTILKGLLHEVIGARMSKETREEDFQEMFAFCLEIADGFQGYNDMTEFGKARREIAEKAWSVLLLGFLRNMVSNDSDADEYEQGKWMNSENFFNREPTTSKLLWFYSSPKGNLPKKHPNGHKEKFAKNFAMNFCRFVLDNSSSELCRESETKIIEMLYKIGSLSILTIPKYRTVSITSIRKLEKLAIKETGKEDIAEALLTGSEVARLSWELDLRRLLIARQRWDESVGGDDIPER